ncbi:MAG TPA: type 1 glutamine amidotransferase domain-containing protein [Rhabdochlamydiaceae bacterium]|jgi:protease I
MAKIVVLVEEIYEDLELWYPKLRLEEAGFHVSVAGPIAGHVYAGKHGYPCKADLTFKDVKAADFKGVVIPGGYAPDRIRRHAEALKIVHECDKAKKLVACICHGGWVAISAKILQGRKVTSFSAIRDDMENAGARWSDEPVIVDHNLISSRTPADLPSFLKAILHFLEK